ncbi:acyltransferase [Clostridium botulinum]|uniref:acyltransferase n=1 Tax=Clostridium botulinum TaxID=1491 RepID=UPI000773B16B|nr:acyltransferase [Clostridium botulinum]NFL87187.1 acyltransferase [Clostridium botulinum]NFO22385.1 acyltransferase [Clostridium botulinum]
MLKCLKVIKWIKSYYRIIKYKCIYGNRLKLEKHKGVKPIYIGKNVNIVIDKKSKIYIKAGSYLSDYTFIQSTNGGIISIGKNTFFNSFCRIICLENIEVGQNCIFGSNVSIYDHNHKICEKGLIADRGFITKPVVIKDNIWFATNVVVTSGVTIESNSVIGANSVVTKNIQGNTVYAGIPANKLRMIDYIN